MSLGCVYCPEDTGHWRPTKFYILDGCSVCQICLRKIQTRYEESGEGYRPLGQDLSLDEILEPTIEATTKYLTGLTMKLYNEDGVCLVSVPVNSPVANGDSIQLPPITLSL